MLRLDINLVFTIINLLIWYAIIRIFLFKPINKVIYKRNAAIQEKYDEAKKDAGRSAGGEREIRSLPG
mgnify:FL=1